MPIPWNDDQTVITGYEGSSAQEFAGQNGYTFISLGIAPELLRGDYNGNGKLTVADAVMLARFISEDTALTDGQIAAILKTEPDYDSDGLVTILDVAALLKALGES